MIYGLTAKPVAGLLGVAQPPPTGVGLLGDDAWLVSFGRHLAEAGVETLLVSTEPSAADQPAQHEGEAALATISLREGVGDVKRAVDDVSLAKVVVSVDPDAALTLLESDLLEDLGRRHILRVPRKRVSAAVPERWTAHAFRGEVTRVDISHRYQAGATVQVVTAPVPDGALLLAAVNGDGDVDLDATPEAADPADTLIALVDAGSTTDD